MSASRGVPCVFARAGTSRGAFLLRSDLPDDQATLDAVVLNAYGSPDPRQINGIGGGDPLTSKVAIVAPSQRPGADVDYTFGQVSVDSAAIFWVGNCGNMSSGVGPFAIRRGLVPVTEPMTKVRIFNTNTNKLLIAEIEVRDGEVVEEGDFAIAGVPGTGSPIMLDFGDCGGAQTGRTLPTGNTHEPVSLSDGTVVQVSIVDATTPFVFVRAADIGMKGTEAAAEIDSNPELLQRLEEIRSYAARAIGLVGEGEVARVVSPSIPRVVAVSPPTDYLCANGTTVAASDVSVVARQLSMQRAHKTYAVTGTLCTGVAGAIPGTVVNDVARFTSGQFNIAHPGGIISARVRVEIGDDDVRVLEASLVRTARVILEGDLRISRTIWP
jgi:2-methylaconitate cis-trans-isomerase PrpF